MRVLGQTARVGSPMLQLLALLKPCFLHQGNGPVTGWSAVACALETQTLAAVLILEGMGSAAVSFFVNEVDTGNRGKTGNHPKVFWKKNYNDGLDRWA